MALAAGCRHVGSGALDPVPSVPHYSAQTGPAVTVDVFRGTPEESWPPQGKLVLWLRARGFPEINCGVQCDYLELRRLATSSQQTGNPPEEFRACDELINASDTVIRRAQPGVEPIGRVPIGADGTINALLLIEDTPENLAATWVLTDETIGGYNAIRCGKVIVSAPE
jgi:hypothetical protein